MADVAPMGGHPGDGRGARRSSRPPGSRRRCGRPGPPGTARSASAPPSTRRPRRSSRPWPAATPATAPQSTRTRLLAGSGALYLCAPAHDQRRFQGVFVAVVKEVLDTAFGVAAARGRLDPPLLVVLDEAAHIAPVAGLDCAGRHLRRARHPAGHGVAGPGPGRRPATGRGRRRCSTTTGPACSSRASRSPPRSSTRARWWARPRSRSARRPAAAASGASPPPPSGDGSCRPRRCGSCPGAPGSSSTASGRRSGSAWCRGGRTRELARRGGPPRRLSGSPT